MSLDSDRSPWKRVRFGDVVRQIKTTVNPETSGLERYVAGEHMDSDELRITRWGTVGDGYLGPAFHRAFKAGQVLYGSRRTYLRKVAHADFDGICANTTFVAESSDPTVLLPELLPFVMTTETFHAHSIAQSKGSVNPYVNWSDLAWYEFDLPPLHDQRRLADLLWAAEGTLRATQMSLSLGHKVEVKLLKHEFPSDWPTKTVAELGDVQLGQQLHPKYRTGTNIRPYLRVANVGDNCLFLDDVASMDFSDAGAEKFRLRANDILLNEGQSIDLVGRCAMFRGEISDCYMQKTLLRFRAGPAILPAFALAWFRRCFYLRQFSETAKRTTSMAHLTAVRFSAMSMPCPPMEEQLELVRRVEAVGRALKIVGKELRAVQQLRFLLLRSMLERHPS
jgi:type I restriction enzyme S subunit